VDDWDRPDGEPECERDRGFEPELQRRSAEPRRSGDGDADDEPGGQPGRCAEGSGQSRTLGGLSRSNMWTVSTKRTCFA
jgi:hypothetical protein